MLTIGLVYGYGQKANGSIDEQTEGRCEKALELYRQGKIQKIFLTVSAGKNGKLMAEEMKRFILGRLLYPTENILVAPCGGNTAGETDVLLRQVIHQGEFRVIPISTWYHLPRIWWLWLCRGYLVWPRASWRAAHWADLRIEPLKMLNALLRPYRSSKISPA